MSNENEVVEGAVNSLERRDFIVKAGRFAAVTPAAVTVLLSTSMEADAGNHGIGKSPGKPRKKWGSSDGRGKGGKGGGRGGRGGRH